MRVKGIYASRLVRDQTKVQQVVLLASCTLFLSSCHGYGRYIPNPGTAAGVAEGISFSQAVAVVNAQDSREEHALGFQGITVDHREVTQSVVDALRAELEHGGTRVRSEAEKVLYVTVTSVGMTPGPMAFRGTINAEVKTGNGHTESFSATRASYASGWNVSTGPTKPLDAAFRDLIKSMLENTALQEYIEN